MVVEAIADLDFESLIDKGPAEADKDRQKAPIRVISQQQYPRTAKRRRLRGVSRGLALAGMLMLATATDSGEGQIASAAATTGNPVPQSVATSSLPRSSEVIKPPIEEKVTALRVVEGQNLYRISLQQVGRYNSQISAELHRLNPWLNEAATIRAGQQLFVPSKKEVPGRREDTFQEASSSPQKGGKNE